MQGVSGEPREAPGGRGRHQSAVCLTGKEEPPEVLLFLALISGLQKLGPSEVWDLIQLAEVVRNRWRLWAL